MDLNFKTLQGIARHSVLENLCFGEMPTQDYIDMVERELYGLIDSARTSSGCLSFDRAYLNFLATAYPGRLSKARSRMGRSLNIARVVEEEFDNLSLLRSAVSKDLSETVRMRKIKPEDCRVEVKRPDLEAIYEIVGNAKEYKRYLKENKGNVEEKYLYHCSLNERWAGIVRYGLKSRPDGIKINGKSLGEGMYFTANGNIREGYMSRLGSFSEDSFVGSKIFGIFQAALTEDNHRIRDNEICVFHEDAVHLKYLVELWAI